jgi:epoxyqueuosine reductase
MGNPLPASYIKQQAYRLGFDACGIAAAHAVDSDQAIHYHQWLANHFNGEMEYLNRQVEKRLDPRKLVEGATSIICVALGYYHTGQFPSSSRTIARYALHNDYHSLIRHRLQLLLEQLRQLDATISGRAFCDSAPLLERYWAEQAGIGWIGKNQLLIIPGKGSWFLLGELIINRETQYDQPIPNRCGRCERCLNSCPTQALLPEKGLDARRCLSYLTIEKKTAFTEEEANWCIENETFFGCDRCQEVCPWNRFSQEQEDPTMQPLSLFLQSDLLKGIDEAIGRKYWKGTCLERLNTYQFRRNLIALSKKRSISKSSD